MVPAGHHYEIVPACLHFLIAEFSINNSLQREVARARLWYHAGGMFKDDRPSMIMLSVNAGVPLLFLVAVVALIFRYMILGAECSRT